MHKTLASVIIPVKNGDRYLAEALESVVAQTYGDREIIVIDGRSTDRSAEIARSFAIDRLIVQPDDGLWSALNLGLAEARGEFMSFLSSDDKWMPEKLARQIEWMQDHPDVAYSVSKVKFFLQEGEEPRVGLRERWLEGEHVGIMPECLVARRSAFELIGGFRTDIEISGDVDWFARAKDMGVPMGVVPETLALRRLHSRNLSLRASTAYEGGRELLGIMKSSIDRRKRMEQEKLSSMDSSELIGGVGETMKDSTT